MTDEVLLMDGDHWRISAKRIDLARVFTAIGALAPRGSVLALAKGALPRSIRPVLESFIDTASGAFPPWLPSEFQSALPIPITSRSLAALADLANTHAEPELALHLVVFTPESLVLEWYDLPSDPIAVSTTLPQATVRSFATAVHAEIERTSGAT